MRAGGSAACKTHLSYSIPALPTLQVWDRRQGKLLHELRAHTQSVSCAVLAHTGHETKRYAVALLRALSLSQSGAAAPTD